MKPLGSADPTHIGPHRVLAILGAGGMGKVYLARTPQRQLAAIKVIHRDLVEDPAFLTRFAREVRTAQMVRGPFTPAVFAADLEATTPWMATEYVPGPTLSEAVAANGPLPEESLRVLILGLARALQSIHSAGLMHRDMKPGNVLISPRGPQVIDFGIARAVEGTVLTKTGEAFGTPSYTSPEAVLGQTQSPASDMFSLAGVVVFAATGAPPFGRGRAAEVLTRVVGADPHLDRVPEGLHSLLVRCLAKNPAERPTSDAIVAELSSQPLPSAEHGWLPSQVHQEIGQHERELHDVAMGAETARLQTPVHGRRRTALIVGAAVAATVLVAGTGLALTRPWSGEDAAAQTPDEPAGDTPASDAPADSGPAFPDTVQGTYFSADGEHLYVHAQDRLSLWDWREGELQETCEERVRAVDVRGDHVVTGFGDRLTVLGSGHEEIASSELPDPTSGAEIATVSVATQSPAVLFTERDDNQESVVHFWEWESDQGWSEEIDDPLWETHLSPDAAHIALLYPYTDGSPARVEVRETDGLDLVHEVVHDVADPDDVLNIDTLNVAFSPDGDLVAIGSGYFETTVVYDLVEDGTVAEFESTHSPQGLSFDHTGERLMLGASPTEALRSGGYQWDLATEEELTSSTTLIYENPTAHPTGETLVVTDDSASTPALIFLDPETLRDTHEVR